MINLTSYGAIQSNLFVRLQIDEYRTTSTGGFAEQVLRFSDKNGSTTIAGETYEGLGQLVNISSTTNEFRVTGGEVVITISGIPNSSIAEIINSKIKGSAVKIYRGISNPTTGVLLNITGNPVSRFTGFVNNYSLQEDWDSDSRVSTNSIVLTCTSMVDILQSKIAGRRTNPQSQKRFYPSDTGMDRVPNLKDSNFDFGAQR